MSLKLENEKNNFSNIIMEINMIQKRKHLLLLNRIMRTELKKDIIKTPSKLTEEEVDKYFNRLFIKKDEYYIPIKSKIEIKIDEQLFKNLIKKPKKKEVKEVEKPKEEVKEVEKPKEEVKEVKKSNEDTIKEYYNIFENYNADEIYEGIQNIFDDYPETKKIKFFANLKWIHRQDSEWSDNKEYQNLILKQLLKFNKLNEFFQLFKEMDEFNKAWEIENIKRNKAFEKPKQEVILKQDILNKKDEESLKKLNKIIDKKAKTNDIAEIFKGKIKFNVIGK
jgi:hypothetical protein